MYETALGDLPFNLCRAYCRYNRLRLGEEESYEFTVHVRVRGVRSGLFLGGSSYQGPVLAGLVHRAVELWPTRGAASKTADWGES